MALQKQRPHKSERERYASCGSSCVPATYSAAAAKGGGTGCWRLTAVNVLELQVYHPAKPFSIRRALLP